jgi:hypothetical protein
MQARLLIWVRQNSRQDAVAAAAGRSDAWLSKRIRGHQPTSAEDRELIQKACSTIIGRRVPMSTLFEPEAA